MWWAGVGSNPPAFRFSGPRNHVRPRTPDRARRALRRRAPSCSASHWSKVRPTCLAKDCGYDAPMCALSVCTPKAQPLSEAAWLVGTLPLLWNFGWRCRLSAFGLSALCLWFVQFLPFALSVPELTSTVPCPSGGPEHHRDSQHAYQTGDDAPKEQPPSGHRHRPAEEREIARQHRTATLVGRHYDDSDNGGRHEQDQAENEHEPRLRSFGVVHSRALAAWQSEDAWPSCLSS